MIDGSLVVAWHGCDVTVRDDLVSGRADPTSSSNRYDWLGPGFYLFEADADRAWDFASNSHANPEKRYTAKPIVEPAVVGCILCVQRCLDMATRLGLREFEAAHKAMVDGLGATGSKVPKNTPAVDVNGDVLLRKLDNAVFRFIHENREQENEPAPAQEPAQEKERKAAIHYQMVRGAFRQGQALAENSGFHRDSHIQLALRDLSCIRGWFLRKGDRLMDAAKMESARDALDKAVKTYSKPRQRAG